MASPPAEPGPGTVDPPTATIVRRLDRRQAAGFVAILLVGGVVLGALALNGSRALGGVAGLLLAAGAFLALAVARARTELGPDGIRNRALFKETFIPWDDVQNITGLDEPPRTIRIVRYNGGSVTLAGVRDGGVSPDGLSFDDIVAVIRERASIEENDEPDASREPGPPLSLRPSRLPLLWVVPAVAAGAAGVVTLFDDSNVGLLNAYLAGMTVVLAFLALKVLRGWTKVDADGIQNRLLMQTATFPWKDVQRLRVTGTPFGRITVVHLESGKKFPLAAPRTGLLGPDRAFDATLDAVAAHATPERVPVDRDMVRTARMVLWVAMLVPLLVGVGLWRPWLSPWWPGRAEASSLPDACAVADTDTAQRMVPDFTGADRTHLDRPYTRTSGCEYTSSGKASLEFELQLWRRTGTTSGTHEARANYASAKKIATLVTEQGPPEGREITKGDVPGLGDLAWRIVEVDKRYKEVDVRLLAVRGNVLVDVHYEADRPTREMEDAATALARKALTAADVH